MKRNLLFLAMLVVNEPSFALESSIQLAADKIQNLGIVMGNLTLVTKIPTLYAPAKVLIPPNNEYVVSTSQAGIINQLNAALGDEVKKGQVLAQIDSPNLLSLHSNYLKAHSALQLANTAYQRDKKLADEGVIAKRRVQETENQFQVASLEVNEAKRLIEIAGGTVGKAGSLNSQLTIHSPISGVIIERMATVGTQIDNTQPLYRVANVQTLWLDIAIPQEEITRIKVGDSVSLDDTTLTAEISLLGQSVNAENQTILARAVVKNAQKQIRVGQKLNVQISQTTQQKAYKVPYTAIAQNDGNAFVFVRNANGFRVQSVKIIGKKDDESIISGEFNGEEIIALKGAAVLKSNWLGLGSSEE